MIRKRKRRKKSNKRLVILLLVASILIILAVAAYLIQHNGPQDLQKKPAVEYFEVLNANVLVGDLLEENTWKISSISFELQAIGGDAHNVIIQSWAMAEPQELENILENESKAVILQSPNGQVVETNNEGMLPVIIKVTSDEAEGKITIPFSPPG